MIDSLLRAEESNDMLPDKAPRSLVAAAMSGVELPVNPVTVRVGEQRAKMGTFVWIETAAILECQFR